MEIPEKKPAITWDSNMKPLPSAVNEYALTYVHIDMLTTNMTSVQFRSKSTVGFNQLPKELMVVDDS